MDELTKKRFFWGVLLAWIPCLPVVLGLMNAFRKVSTQKATGVGVVAGGFTEGFFIFGVGVAFVFEVGAIVLLLRTFSSGNVARSLFSGVSIFMSGLIISLLGLLLWFLFFWLPRAAGAH